MWDGSNPYIASFRPGRYRARALLALLICIGFALYRHVPMLVLVALLAMARQPLSQALAPAPRRIQLAPGDWQQVWMLSFAVSVSLGAGRYLWVFADELNPAEWTRLRRYLRVYTPRAPWGLRISR